MIKCPAPNCNAQMVWGADFDAEEYGYDEKGVVSTYTCSKCNSTFDHVQLELKSERQKDWEILLGEGEQDESALF